MLKYIRNCLLSLTSAYLIHTTAVLHTIMYSYGILMYTKLIKYKFKNLAIFLSTKLTFGKQTNSQCEYIFMHLRSFTVDIVPADAVVSL